MTNTKAINSDILNTAQANRALLLRRALLACVVTAWPLTAAFAAEPTGTTEPEAALLAAEERAPSIIEFAEEHIVGQHTWQAKDGRHLQMSEGEVLMNPADLPTASEHDLATRMQAALSGSRSPRRVLAQRSTSTSQKEWRCGGWDELWQGRGRARTCEWR